MKYILFANNTDLTDAVLDDIRIDDNDIFVTFNHAWPVNNLKNFNNYPNKIYHFSRRSFNRKILYSGILIIDKIKEKFHKIFLYPHPDSLGSKQKKQEIKDFIKNNTTFDTKNFSHMINFGQSKNTKEARHFLSQRYNKITNLSIGLIGYLYLQQIKNINDEIILIGFTHKINKNKHNPQGEEDFFNDQREKKLCQIIKPK
jgi:hypothetical protein